MSIAVSEPYLLSSYTLPKRVSRSGSKSFANAYATHHQATTNTADGYVTVTAQGDGVHVLDVSTCSVGSPSLGDFSRSRQHSMVTLNFCCR